MHDVFADALVAADKQGRSAVLQFCWRELRDLPRLLITEHWHATHHWFALRLAKDDPMRSDLPGVVPVGNGSLLHALFVITGRSPRLRRGCDIAIALVGLLLVSPFLLLLPILIKIDSAGPIFYRQQRLGRAGQCYTMYKFRSMVAASSASPIERRITRIGLLIRQWHLDEMPQVFNVIKGDMSIFGPRPPLPD
jgi:hypothetical protein